MSSARRWRAVAPLDQITKEGLVGKLPLGVFRQELRPEYTRGYAALCAESRRQE